MQKFKLGATDKTTVEATHAEVIETKGKQLDGAQLLTMTPLDTEGGKVIKGTETWKVAVAIVMSKVVMELLSRKAMECSVRYGRGEVSAHKMAQK